MRIPLTGPRAKKQDYYSVSLVRANHQPPDLLLRKSGQRGAVCREWDGDRYSKKRAISWEELKGSSIEIRHYLSGHEFRYESHFSFLWRDPWLPKLILLKNMLLQKLYNSRTPIRSSRIDLLKMLVRRRVDSLGEQESNFTTNETGDNITDLLTEVYDIKVFGHPQFSAYRAHLLVDLDSLVATGDVKITDYKYIATGKAVATIADYEEENRRHLDNKKHNHRILLLTVVLALVGLLQIPYVQELLGVGPSK